MRTAALRNVGLVASSPNPRQKEFHFSTNYVSELYLSNLPPVKTYGVYVANVRLKPFGSVLQRMEQSDRLIEVDREFDFAGFWSGDEVMRKDMSLGALHAGLVEIASSEGWEVEPFHIGYTRCRGPRTAHEFRWGRVAWSPRRLMWAEITCVFDSKGIVVTVTVNDRIGTVRLQEVVASLNPHPIYLKGAIGWVRWRSSNVVEVVNAAEEVIVRREVK